MNQPPFPGDLLPISKRGQSAKRRLKERLWDEQEGVCFYCDRPLARIGPTPTLWTLDHVLALANGGPDDENNVVLACDECNRAKGCLTVEQLRSMADRIERFLKSLRRTGPVPGKIRSE